MVLSQFEYYYVHISINVYVILIGTPRQSWDHHIKDGYRKSSSGSNTPIKSNWDGLKASKVVQELQNLSSYGYGAPGM